MRTEFHSLFGLLSLVSVVELFASTTVANDERPSLLLILVDDLGYGDLGCNGAKDLDTPHIDRLLKQVHVGLPDRERRPAARG